MPVENVTANRLYKLPHASNLTADDVERLIDALGAVDSDVASLLASLAAKAGLSSPVFTDVPEAPTAVAGTSSAQIATTAFVAGEIDALDIEGEFDAVDAALAKRVSVDGAQAFSDAEKGRGRANLGVDVLGGFRNKIINGDFDFWQRSTSQTTNGYGAADRWRLDTLGSTKTLTRENFTLGQADVPGNPRHFVRTVVSSVAGAGNYAQLQQRIEHVRTLSGRKATVTFWAKADAARSMSAEIVQFFGAGGSPSAVEFGVNVQKVTLGTEWTKFSYTVDITSVLEKTLGSDGNSFLSIVFWFDAGSSFDARTSSLGQQSGTFDIAHVSIVEGDATAEADPFSPRHLGQELTLCQRYFQMLNGYNNNYGYADGYEGAARRRYWASRLPTIMRATPSVTENPTFTVSGGGSTTAGGAFASTEGVVIRTASDIPAGGSVIWGSGTIALDAEI